MFNHVLVLVPLLILLAQAIEFEIFNKENDTIWVVNQPINGHTPLENGGFPMKPGETKRISTSVKWSGRIWARTHCDGSPGNCLTGACGSMPHCTGDADENSTPYSHVGFQWKRGYYWYGISFANGFNVPLSVEAMGNGNCNPAFCKQHLNDACPEVYKFDRKNVTVGCVSPCTLYKTDDFCCKGEYKDENACNAVRFPADFEDFYFNSCPDAIIRSQLPWKYDCRARRFIITFGVLIPVSRLGMCDCPVATCPKIDL